MYWAQQRSSSTCLGKPMRSRRALPPAGRTPKRQNFNRRRSISSWTPTKTLKSSNSTQIPRTTSEERLSGLKRGLYLMSNREKRDSLDYFYAARLIRGSKSIYNYLA